MLRALFEKTGNAVYISHLDLMRLFQRAFKRAGLSLTHTQGYNPRASVSIALPLSVGVQSKCELLDFDLEGERPGLEEMAFRLNEKLVDGVKILKIYEDGKKLKHLKFLDCRMVWEYDGGISQGCIPALDKLFSKESLTVEKKGKNGPVQQDIIPLIKSIQITEADANTLCLNARICCQEPSLNPAQLVAAVKSYLPEYAPDFCQTCRLEVYDETETIFR